MTERIAATGIVLAGGRSRRFGGDKLGVEIDGRTILDRAIAAVAEVCSEVLVVCAPGASPHLAPQPGIALTIVHDPESFGGPLVGLGAALAVATRSVALVVGGDMPSLVPAVLRAMLGALSEGRPAVTLEVPGRIQPLPMALAVDPARLAQARVRERGGRALRDLLADLGASALPAQVWLALDPASATIRDVDRPDDL